MNMTTTLVALPFFAAALAAAASGAFFEVNGAWYQSLRAPSFRPPPWLFGPVWTVLYVMIAAAGTRLALHAEGADAPALVAVCLGLWALQMVLNALWTPVFFGAHDLGGALVLIVLMFASTALLAGLAWKVDRVAALLLLPYLGWVGFATILNAAFWWLNR
ncbi:TspO and MBR related proteins [Ruegeria intermedia]|uniref:Tryptophan-rich sensory protein n=3 Tax=Alphaproteobacteria TaxID=28211 RepID=A0A1H5YZ08_9RHOB|nr:tryptophan-rich sensory protein [Jhaorihella thermophila]SHF31706.1 TspO and MBR related proteins [Ruegeria intermedia]